MSRPPSPLLRACLAPLLISMLLASAEALAEAPRQTYIVRLDAPPIASFRGPGEDPRMKAAGLEATSPAKTGAARLDMKSAAVLRYRDWLSDERAGVLAEAAMTLGRPLEPGFEYDVAFNGFSIELDEAEARTIAALPGVAAVDAEWVDRLQTDAGPGWIGVPSIWNGSAGPLATRGEGVVVGVIDSGINASHPSFAELSAVDGYRHANPRGQRYGLCLTQPALCNDKLIGIHDFSICTGTHASDSCDDREANDGSDPDGHGSHVAATVVGNPVGASLNLPGGRSQALQLSGVAPRANLIAYKACEEEETCRGSWLLAAINQATADGVDLFNYSIGGSIGSTTPWTTADSLAMLSAREAGIVVVVSAGNGGPGAGTVSRPADAPWVLSVANSSHDRLIANRLVDLSGGSSAPPGGGVLLGDGFTGGFGPANIVVPTDFPLCSQGDGLDSPPSGASNPWQPGRFSGEIVVCLRGITARVAKSNNVRLAGGGGMVLVNQSADGEGTVADEHSIPATHLGFSAGQSLLQWLSSGSGHRGRLEGTEVRSAPERADVLSGSSSRGPVAAGDYLKPDVAAPGSNVLAAAGEGNGFRFLSGTSMAAPHVAGLVALLRAQNPQWSVSRLESAVRTTAQANIRLAPGGAMATPLQQGSGRIDAAKAAASALSFELDGNALRAARPAFGGNPRTLNLPSLYHGDCRERCSFQRQVTAGSSAGRWRAVVQAPEGMGVSVQPADFSLAAGGTQSLSFEVSIGDSRLLGQQVEARVLLQPIDEAGNAVAAPAATAVPVLVFASPGTPPSEIVISTPLDRGFADLGLNDLVALQDIELAGTALAAPRTSQRSLQLDPSRDSPYDENANGAFFELVDLPAGVPEAEYLLRAVTSSASAGEIRLFVGRDSNGDGRPEQAEELCRATGTDVQKRCEVAVLARSGERFWVLVQNYSAGSSGIDSVTLDTTLIDLTPRNTQLVATGPASSLSGRQLPIRAAWDVPDLLPGERREGFILLGAGGRGVGLLRVPIVLQRTAQPQPAARLLASGDRLALRLAPGAASNRLAIDVPPGASELRVQSEGSGDIALYLSRVDTPAGPALGVAPPIEQAQLSATGIGADRSLVATPGNGLRAGRWYVTPVNTGTAVAEFSLQLSLTGSSAALPDVGAYFNPDRDGAGAFLFEAEGSWGLLWYTYLQDASPTWYIASAPPPGAGQGQWKADLFRARWNGSEAPLTAVGSVVLTLDGRDSVQFGWNLDGESGSERYRFIDGGGCARSGGAPFDINGFWFNPAQPGYGYSVNAFPAVETNGAYFFDSRGYARWALGAVAPFGSDTLVFDQRRGSCPSCAYAPPQVVEGIGTLVRRYDSTGAGQMRIDLELVPPLSGSWQLDTPVQKLTADSGCD